MQNTVTRQDETGAEIEVTIYTEHTHSSKFVIREMLETKNPDLRFQAGRYVMEPMVIPVYKNSVISHHKLGDEIQKFEIHGSGRTKEDALDAASNKLLREEILKANQ